MNLEDIFKQKPRTEYVTAPEPDKLQAFFADRNNIPAQPAPVSAPVPKVEEKLSEPRAQAIKDIFRPQAAPQVSQEVSSQQSSSEQIPQQGQYTPQAAANTPQQAPKAVQNSSTIDYQAIRDEAAGMMPERGMGDILPSLVPLAIEAIFGGGNAGGVSYGVAGKNLLSTEEARGKRQNTLEDKILEIQKARAISGAKAGKGNNRQFQSKNVYDKETGKTYFINYDTSTGTYSDPAGNPISQDKLRTGFAIVPEENNRRREADLLAAKEKIDYTPRINPETGMPSRQTGKGMESIFPQVGELNPKQQKDLTQVTNKFLGSEVYKGAVGTLTAVSGVDDLLKSASSGNPAAANFARKELAKMAEGAGRLSDMDVEMVSGSPSFKARAKRFANLQKTNVPLTEIDIAELREVADILEKDARRKLDIGVSGIEKDFVENLGGTKGAVGKKMSGYIPQKKVKKPLFEEWKKSKGVK